MEVLKFFVVIMILAMGIAYGEEHIHRRGKCGHSSMSAQSKFQGRTNIKKNNKFIGKPAFIKNGPAKPVPPPAPEETPVNSPEDLDVRGDFAESPSNNYARLSNDYARPSRDSPKQLFISDDGAISYARSLNFNKVRTFHADDSAEEANAEQKDEGRDTFHKIRTARGAPDQSPQQLSSTLGAMQGEGTQSLNDVSASNSATAGDNLYVEATGMNISVTHFGNSASYGEGSVNVAGYSTNSVTSGPGWKSP